MTKPRSKVISIVLAVLIFIGIFPLNALAQTITENQGMYVNASYVTVPGSNTPGKRNDDGSYTGKSYQYMRDGEKHNLLMMFLKPRPEAEYRDISYAIKDNNGSIMWVYCIEYDKDVSGSSQGNAKKIQDSPYWRGLSAQAKKGITYAQMYGFPANNFGVSNCDAYAATQFIIWEYNKGYRNANGDRTNDHLYNAIKGTRAETAYNGIIAAIKSHNTDPSFVNGINIELKYNPSAGNYSATLTDTKNVLSKFNITSSNSAASVSKSGNTITITSKTPISNATLSFAENIKTVYAQPQMVLENPTYQRTIFGQVYDPYNTKLTFSTQELGSAKILKESEDGIISGLRFRISGNGINEVITTGTDGTIIKNNLVPGEYTITEIDVPNRYIQPQAKKITVEANKTAAVTFENLLKTGSVKIVKTSEDDIVEGIEFLFTGKGINQIVSTDANGEFKIDDLKPGVYTVTEKTYDEYEPQASQQVTVIGGETSIVNFNNTLKRGSLEVKKTSEDDYVEYVTFHLFGTSISGLTVDEYAVTDENGIARFENILISGSESYTLEEVDTAIRYIIPGSQTSVIEWNEVSRHSFENKLKKFNVTVEKSDAETGTAQGEATLEGAVYGLYNGDKLVKSYVTDVSGKFTTDTYLCGDNWTIKEISPSKGYRLDSTVYNVGASAGNFTLELNELQKEVKEEIIKGKIDIAKYMLDTNTQVKTPEANAEFQIYLKSAGTFNAAKETERDVLKTDLNGNATSKLLPYGTYTVHQTKGTDGYYFINDFDVAISENEKTYQFTLDNELITSNIKILKKDAETKKTVPVSGAGFKIKNTDTGEFVINATADPTAKDADIFYTDATGRVILHQGLGWGNYEAIEVIAPNGYILDNTPVKFTVDSSNEVVIVKEDIPQKGKITISKTGEIFNSVTANGGVYTPVYDIQGLKDTLFDVKAAEDIYTPDGTLKYSKGEVVDTVKTNQNGIAITKELYLGKYTVIEKSVTEGFVIDHTPYGVELKYAGGSASATAANLFVKNERQKVEIDLSKAMEKDNIFGTGNNDEIKNVVFGLYTAEELKAKDGSKIPADGLIELIHVDDNGYAMFSADVPFGKYYIKEFTTDAHYILSDEKYGIEFKYGGPEITVIKITANGGEVIVNEMIRGNIDGKKIDENDKPVPGAIIGLFRESETIFTEDTAFVTGISDENGIFYFSDIPYGKYVVREIKSPEEFLLNEKTYPVVIKEQNEHIEIEIENIRITGAVQTAKVDKTQPTYKLSDAEFEVYIDVDGNKKFSSGDILAGTLSEIEIGVYRLENLKYGGYLLHEKTAPEGFLADENYYYFEISAEGVTVTVETEAGIGFMDEPIIGSVEIVKKDKDTQEYLSGAGFRIIDAKTGLVLAEDYTNINGVAKFELRYGKYLYQEFKAPDGYLLNDTKYPFEITKNGEVIKVEMTNQPIVGFIELTKTDISTGESLANAGFRIKDADTGIIVAEGYTDKNGIAKFELKYGRYTYEEFDAPEGYLIDSTVVPFEITESGQVIKAEIANKPVVGSLELIKTDVTTGAPIVNVGFRIKDAETKKTVFEGYTDEQGIIKFELRYGKYLYQEFKAADGFVLDDTEYPFEITSDGEIIKAQISNGPVMGTIEIVKKDADTDTPIPNVGFRVKNADTGVTITEGYTNEKGVVKFELRYGKYVYQEFKAAEGFLLDDREFAFNITQNNEVIKAEMANTPIEGVFEFTKKDVSTGDPVPNAGFNIKNVDTGKIVASGYTDENGIAAFTLRYGKYTYQEFDAPEGFLLDEREFPFEITKDGQIVKAEMTNVPVMGFVEISKADVVTGDPLPNAGFRIRDIAGNIVVEGYTDKNGVAKFELRYGRYTYEEFDAPEGYLIDNTRHPFEITHDGQIVKVEMDNKPIVGEIQILKMDVSYGTPIKGAGFRIKDAETGEIVSEGYTDENGIVKFTLRYGKYNYQEFKAPDGYLLDGVELPFEITESGQIIKKEMTNDPITGVIEILKIDAQTGDSLSNAGFRIINELGDVVTEGYTDENGIARFELRYGKYFYQEFDAPEGYLVCDTEFPFEITENGKTIKLEMSNAPIIGSIKITKKDVITGELLPNVGFRIFDAETGALVKEGYTGEDGVVEFELRYGKYTYQEFESLDGFVLNETKFPFEIKEDGEIIKVEMTNNPIMGTLEITKIDVATGKVLSNAGFRIKDAETGEIVAEGYTDENGIARFELRYGKYTYQEFDAPNGYQIDEKEYDFEIKKDGEIVKAKMENTAIPTPVTGYDSPLYLYVLVIIGSTAMYAALYRKYKKNTNKGDV